MAYHGENACRCWINFNGSGTIGIRDSYNVSSISDNGTGNYSINFSSNMDNTNYCVTGTCTYLIGTVPRFRILSGYNWSTSYVQVITGYTDTSGADHQVVGVTVYN